MWLGSAYDFSTVLADLRAGTIFLIDVFPVILRVRAKPALACKAASAANGFGYAIFRDLFRVVVHAGPTSAAIIRHTVANRVAAPLSVSDVPAVSQRIPECQNISRLQIGLVHAVRRIRSVNFIFPAGAFREVQFTETDARPVQAQTVAVDAAPENVQIGALTELCVDPIEVFFVCTTPCTAHCVCLRTKAGMIVETSQIEVNTHRVVTFGRPAETLLRRAEGLRSFITPDRLCNCTGRRLARQHVACNR